MVDATPGQIRDVNQAVHTADIDERAELGQAANDAVDDSALFKVLPGSLLAGSGLLSNDSLAGSHDALLLLVHFDDLEFHFLANELFNLVNIVLRELGGGHESTHALNISNQAALDGFLANALDILARVVLGDERFPRLAVDDVALGQNDIAFAVVHFDDLSFQFVTFFDVLLGQVGALDDAIGLVANVHIHFVRGHLHNFAGHRLSSLDARHRGHDGVHGEVRGLSHVFVVGHMGCNLL